ncbi:MAG: alpha/beta hydrolase [Gemmatimonadota bacterium]
MVGALSLLLIAAGVWLALAAVGWWFGERLMFPRPPVSYGEHEDLLELRAPTGERLAARWLPDPEARLALLYSHGNYEDLGTILPEAERLRRLGYAVLTYDYRGYGRSAGRCTVRGAVEDLEAAYRWLLEEAGYTPDRVVLYGRSVGGGPTLDLATREPVGGVILEGTFLTPFRVVTRLPLLPFDHFRNDRLIGNVDCPVLVIHGTRDRVVPFSHGRALYLRAPEPKRHLWVEGAGHNDLTLVAGAAYEEAVREFCRVVEERVDAGGPTG